MIFFIGFLCFMGGFVIAGLTPRPASEHLTYPAMVFVVVLCYGGIIVMALSTIAWLFTLTF
jgi:hypothetical protein